MITDNVAARFDDLRTGTARVFGPPWKQLAAHSLDEVRDLIDTVDRLTRNGAWAWGFVSYDAAPAFDLALQVKRRTSSEMPLAHFAFGPEPTVGPSVRPPSTTGSADKGAWHLDWDGAEHGERVEHIRGAIAAGEIYQANLTTQLHLCWDDDPVDLYAGLAHAQRGAYNALLSTGSHIVISASPELFFRWDGDGVTVRPMKGTARRGGTNDEDLRARRALTSSAKERAENVMIVDLLRNDLARIAQTGSVRVQSLLDVERYETVWQLTSTVKCTPLPEANLLDMFDALFPCGSVTGAPKVAAMRHISRLESRPRGLYCGAIGIIAPPGSAFRAQFSVAIRTVIVDLSRKIGTYGVGGAVTWDSRAQQEYDELLAKAEVLNEPATDFQLLETLRFEPNKGLRNLDRHLQRMLDSARYFGFTADADDIRSTIDGVMFTFPTTEPLRIRLVLHRDGVLVVEHAVAPTVCEPVNVVVDSFVTTASRWTKHKTTRRGQYDAAERRNPAADEVILVNTSGHVVETTRSNIAFKLGGCWYTPPVSSGCLPGVGRQLLLDSGDLCERTIAVADLERCEELAVVNSLRGWRAARLVPPKARVES